MDEQVYFQALLNEFGTRLYLDPQLRQIMKKIEQGKADFSDTAHLSERASNLLGEVFGANVADIPAEAREAVCTALLKDRYDSMNGTLAAVQEALDEPLGLHLTPQKAPFPSERVEQLAHSLVDPTVKPETIQRRANQPVATVAKSFHDDYIKTNARFRNRLGLKPVIKRFGVGCCQWCAEVAGTYRFGEQPEDVFRRHDNCGCVIIYDTQVLRGARTADGGRSRAWTEVDPSDLQANPPASLSREEAERLQENAPNRLTLGGERGITEAEGVKPMIRAIEQPIEQQHTGKGNPNAILQFGVSLNNRQMDLLEHLKEYDSRHTVPKKEVNMSDLAALTAYTGDEFAMFTKGGNRLVIRGDYRSVNIDVDAAEKLAKEGFRWSGHTHPGTDFLCMQPSDGDYAILSSFKQSNSVIYNSKGDFRTFEKRGENNV